MARTLTLKREKKSNDNIIEFIEAKKERKLKLGRKKNKKRELKLEKIKKERELNLYRKPFKDAFKVPEVYDPLQVFLGNNNDTSNLEKLIPNVCRRGEKFDIKLSNKEMEIIMRYTLDIDDNDNKNILKNIFNLVNHISLKHYNNESEAKVRLLMLQYIVYNKKKGYTDEGTILSMVEENFKEFEDVVEEVIYNITNMELKTKEVIYVQSLIFKKLDAMCLIRKKDALEKLLDVLNFGSDTKFNKKKTINMLREIIDDLNKLEEENPLSPSEESFCLMTKSLERMIKQTLKDYSKVGFKKKTMIKGLNRLLNGGFENGRFYLFSATTGGFKSGTLLNMAYQIKKANNGYKPKIKGAIPTILYVTQENTVRETLERFFAIGSKYPDDRLYNYGPGDSEYIMSVFREIGLIYDPSVSNIDIIVRYTEADSTSVDDIKDLVEKIETEENREVIVLVHDYLARLETYKSTSAYENALAIADNVNKFKNFANQKQIPILSASQLSKSAETSINNALQSGQTDLGKLPQKEHVAESYKSVANSDVMMTIVLERLENKELVAGLKLVKSRNGHIGKSDYIVVPFEKNEFAYVQDADLPEGVEKTFNNVAEYLLARGGTVTLTNNDNQNLMPKRETKDYPEMQQNYKDIFTSAA